MSELLELAAEIGELIRAKAHRFYVASNFIKIVLVIGGSVIAAVAHFFVGEHATGPLPTANVVGIIASVLVGIGGLFLLIADWDASADLEAARKAIQKASDAQLALDREESGAYQREREHVIALTRAIELYAAMDQMRSVVHSVLSAAKVDETIALNTLLETCSRSISIASGFLLSDNSTAGHWTIGIYGAEVDAVTNRTMLRCVAHNRSTACDVSRARVWPEGVGVAGAAYASGSGDERSAGPLPR